MKDYEYKTQPFKHQKDILDESCDKEYVSLFLKPGLGKTFIIINNVCYLYERELIDTLVVVAPNGVHLNWCSDEIPAHMPDRIRSKTKCHIWHSSKAKTKKAERERDQLLNHDGLSVLVVAYEASITDAFKAYMKKVFAKRTVFMCLDEAHRIKGRDSRVKKTLTAMGAYAKYRRILTGTPTEKPVDIYSLIRFLSKDFWASKGLGTSSEFDARYCIQVDRSFHGRPSFKQTVGYKNLDELKRYVAETGYSMTLEQAGIYLPPIIYSKRYYEMFPEQRRAYENLRDQFVHEFEDGQIVDAESAITRLLRLQQVICGYVGTGPGEPIRLIDEKKNPRLDLAVDEILTGLEGQAIVWCRFTQDVDQLMNRLGPDACRYDGQVDETDRAIAKATFQAGDKKYIVMTSAGAEGLTLLGGTTMVFYSNSFRMITREQMEGRSWRIGQKSNVNAIDLVCPDTVDEDILEALKNKFDMSSRLTGAKLREWL